MISLASCASFLFHQLLPRSTVFLCFSSIRGIFGRDDFGVQYVVLIAEIVRFLMPIIVDALARTIGSARHGRALGDSATRPISRRAHSVSALTSTNGVYVQICVHRFAKCLSARIGVAGATLIQK